MGKLRSLAASFRGYGRGELFLEEGQGFMEIGLGKFSSTIGRNFLLANDESVHCRAIDAAKHGVWHFFAIVWSIWLMRNDMVYNNKDFDIRYPNLINILLRDKSVKVVTMWIPPPYGCMKFNVDGFSKDKSGPVGIGGILGDNLSVIKMVFSKFVGMEDSNMAELLAVREAMCLFISSC
ncbi:hypothetical protein CRYUN_Cryun04dG0127700 [Craigia yunnanensis]